MSSFTFADSLQVAQFGLTAGEPLLRALLDLPSVDVVAVWDESEDAFARARRLAPNARATTDTESILSDTTIGALVIATGPEPLAEAALDAGKHVFLDRAPLRADLAGRLVALAKSQNRRLVIGSHLRYHSGFRDVSRRIEQGDLGEIRTLDAVFAGPASGPRDLPLARLAEGLDVSNAFLGEAVAVSAQGRAFAGESQDVVLATVEYASGALAHSHCSTLHPRETRRATVVGSRQSVELDWRHASEPVRVYHPGAGLADELGEAGSVVVPRVEAAERWRLQMEAFVSFIRENPAPRTDGLEIARVLDAVRQSLAEGARVEV